MERLPAFFLGLGIMACLVPSSEAGGYKVERILLKSGSIPIEAVSSATLVEGSNAHRYSIRNLFDNDKATAWVTKFDRKSTYRDDGLFRFVFEVPVFVKSITVMNGCQVSESLFNANQRIKTLNIEKVIIGGRSFPLENTVTLRDSREAQEVSLQRGWPQSINLFRTKELIFNVFDIYDGTKYQDLCISEITVSSSSNLEYSPSISWKELQGLIDKNSIKKKNGWDWEGLSRNNFALFNDLLYYVLTGNKEAHSRFITYAPEGTAQAEAMRNIYRNAVKESLVDIRGVL